MTYEPMPTGYALRSAKVAAAIEYVSAAGDSEPFAYACRYMDAVGIIPDWVERWMRSPKASYEVTHGGREYSVVATSEAQAVNSVRYRLYGTRPAASLPPFTARRKTSGQTLAKRDALARLNHLVNT